MFLAKEIHAPRVRLGLSGICRHQMIYGGHKGICRPPEIIYTFLYATFFWEGQ